MPVYDFFVDEDKQNHRLGVVAVPNVTALNQILENVRVQYGIRREVKWGAVDRFRLPVAISWVRIATWFNGLRFACLDWPGQGQKGNLLAEFLDFDNVDKPGNLHAFIVRQARILRCYPLDSKASNILQLVDLLLGSWVRSHQLPGVTSTELLARWVDVDAVLRSHQKLTTPDFTGSESREYLAGYASQRVPKLLVVKK